MKCHDPDSNSIVSAYVRAGNEICPEYNILNTDRTIQSWVPVDTGQTITLGCDVRTSATRYQMDLIVDGVLRNTRLVEKQSPRLRHELFEEAYFREKTLVQRGTMKVVRLSPKASLRKDSTPEALGTLEIRLYKSETGSDVHKPSTTPFFEVESWRDLRGLQGTGSIEPDHEIQFVHGTSLKTRGQNLLKAKMKEERLGSRHWLSFKFYYRCVFAIILANPEMQVSPTSVIKLPRSIPVITTNPNRDPKSAVAQTNNADKQNAGKNRDQVLGVGKNHHITEELHTESSSLSMPTEQLSSKKRSSISPAAVQPITPSKTSIFNLTQSLADLSEEAATAQKRLILAPLPSSAPRSDHVQSNGLLNKLRYTVPPEWAQFLGEEAKTNAAKRHGPKAPETIDVVDQLRIGNNDSSATVKRRKTDVDQLRAELGEDRRLMEESKRHVDELLRKTAERQRQLNEEWDEMQRLRLKYKATTMENQRQAEAVSKELEDMERAKPETV